MAKLEGVKVIDMTDGEVTKISYKGEEYSKFTGVPQAGDVGVIEKPWGTLNKGEYYEIEEVESEVQGTYTHIEGDIKVGKYEDGDMLYFRKADEETETDLPAGTKIKIKSDGRLMTLSERKPKHDGVGFGKAYGLKGKSTWLGEEQFEVVEGSGEVTKPSFKDGDIAVVTGETYCGNICKGVKVRVTRAELDEDGELKIDLLDGSDFDWAKPEALELVVDEGETTLKNGDIAIALESTGPHPEGTIVEITEDGGFGFKVYDEGGFLSCPHWFELVVPVEERYDKDVE